MKARWISAYTNLANAAAPSGVGASLPVGVALGTADGDAAELSDGSSRGSADELVHADSVTTPSRATPASTRMMRSLFAALARVPPRPQVQPWGLRQCAA